MVLKVENVEDNSKSSRSLSSIEDDGQSDIYIAKIGTLINVKFENTRGGYEDDDKQIVMLPKFLESPSCEYLEYEVEYE